MQKTLTAAAALAVGLAAMMISVRVDPIGTKPAWAQDAAPDEDKGKGSGKGKRGPVPVETTSARAATSTTTIRAVGSLQSDESVNIAPEVAGRIAEIVFKEGDQAKQGDAMVKLDDSLARAEVADQEARYEFAKANYERALRLAQTGNITERQRDEAKQVHDSARAVLDLARSRLAKHTLMAPFSGVVGLRAISVGAFVNIGTMIVNLEKIDTLKLDFNIPERFLSNVEPGQSVDVTVDAFPGRTFAGTIYAIDPMVDVNGRSLKIRARLPNDKLTLRPGLFARITVKGPQVNSVVTVPESAIVPRGTDSYVYRIIDGKAVETKVRLGERKAGHVEIIEGIAPDAIVVTAGQQRLRHGATVDVVASDPRVPG
jgi:membrane fusion protein, multidrug efflux system